MKKLNKEIATIKLYSPKGETMVWKTSINHVSRNRVKDLKIAKRNFAHYLVNKYWLLDGKAEEIVIGYKETIIRPIAKDRNELYKRKEEMRKEIDSLSEEIIARRIRYVKKESSSSFNHGGKDYE